MRIICKLVTWHFQSNATELIAQLLNLEAVFRHISQDHLALTLNPTWKEKTLF